MSFQIGDQYMELSGEEDNDLDSNRNTLNLETEDRDYPGEEDDSCVDLINRPRDCDKMTTGTTGLLRKNARCVNYSFNPLANPLTLIVKKEFYKGCSKV